LSFQSRSDWPKSRSGISGYSTLKPKAFKCFYLLRISTPNKSINANSSRKEIQFCLNKSTIDPLSAIQVQFLRYPSRFVNEIKKISIYESKNEFLVLGLDQKNLNVSKDLRSGSINNLSLAARSYPKIKTEVCLRDFQASSKKISRSLKEQNREREEKLSVFDWLTTKDINGYPREIKISSIK